MEKVLTNLFNVFSFGRESIVDSISLYRDTLDNYRYKVKLSYYQYEGHKKYDFSNDPLPKIKTGEQILDIIVSSKLEHNVDIKIGLIHSPLVINKKGFILNGKNHKDQWIKVKFQVIKSHLFVIKDGREYDLNYIKGILSQSYHSNEYLNSLCNLTLDRNLINKFNTNYEVEFTDFSFSLEILEFIEKNYKSFKELDLTPFDIDFMDSNRMIQYHLTKSYPSIRKRLSYYLNNKKPYPETDKNPVQKEINKALSLQGNIYNSVQTPKLTNAISFHSQNNTIYFMKDFNLESIRVNSLPLYPIVDSIHSSEGQDINIKNILSLSVSMDGKGSLLIKVYNKKFEEEVLTLEDFYKSSILNVDCIDFNLKSFKRSTYGSYNITRWGKFSQVDSLDKVDYLRTPYTLTSPASSCIPMLNKTDPTRGLLGSHMRTQSLICHKSSPSIIGSDLSNYLYENNPLNIRSEHKGKVSELFENHIKVLTDLGETVYYSCPSFGYTTDLNVGGSLVEGDIIFYHNTFKNGEESLGVILNTAFMPYYGYGHEDGIIISESCAQKLKVTTREKIEIVLERGVYIVNPTSFVSLHKEVFKGDTLFSYKEDISKSKSPLSKLAREVFPPREVEKLVKDHVLKVPPHIESGVIKEIRIIFHNKELDDLKKLSNQYYESLNKFYNKKMIPFRKEDPDLDYTIQFFIEYDIPVVLSDKITNRYGSKGVISKIVPDTEMPRNKETGEIYEIIMSPMSTASRKNISQVYECQLSRILKHLGDKYRSFQMGDPEYKALELLYGVQDNYSHYYRGGFFTIKLSPYDFKLTPDFMDSLFNTLGIEKTNLVQLGEGGRVVRTPILTGYCEYTRLDFIPREKAKATPFIEYTTNYDLLGSTRKGGQMLGEQEYWSLLANGMEEFYLDEVGKLEDKGNRFQIDLLKLGLQLKK